MKDVIKKCPTITGVFINIVGWLLAIYAVKYDDYLYLLPLAFTFSLIKWILAEGEGLNKKRRVVLHLSFLGMAIVSLYMT